MKKASGGHRLGWPVFLLFWLCCVPSILMGEEMRLRPIRDPVGFCWQAGPMDDLVAFLKARESAGSRGPILAAIVPHDDYLYAGQISYRALSLVEASEVLIVGVTHSAVRKSLNNPEGVLILDGFSHWQGPYGPVPVSELRDRIKRDLPRSSWIENDAAQSMEHSIESLVPFLQQRHRDLSLTSIMVTATALDSMEGIAQNLARIADRYLIETGKKWGRDFCILISADGNHYGPDFDNLDFGRGLEAHRRATAYDLAILNQMTSAPLSAGQIADISRALWGNDFRERGSVLWCGKYSIPFGLHLVMALQRLRNGEKGLQGVLLGYGDSFSDGVLPFRGGELGITAPFSLDHWVSFFALAYCEPSR